MVTTEASTGPWAEIVTRLAPTPGPPPFTATAWGVVVALALAAVLVDPLWQALRIVVTLVHELGHAFVGVLCGRRFTGFVLRGDMSGHAVTVGAPTGPGRVLTTWAGYPMPGLVALAVAWVASRGYAGSSLAVAALALLVALPRVRSLLTFVVVVALGAVIGALWWWRVDTVQTQVLIGVALVLLIGGWRHLWAVVSVGSGPGSGSDPAVLRQLTGIPAVVWNLTFALVLAAATYGTWRLLIP